MKKIVAVLILVSALLFVWGSPAQAGSALRENGWDPEWSKIRTELGGMAGTPFDFISQPDGKLVIAGAGQDAAGVVTLGVRYHLSGTLDSEYGSQGVMTATSPVAFSVADTAVLTDGKILITGRQGFSNMVILKYQQNGTLDLTFNGTGVVTRTWYGNSAPMAITVQPDGKIIVVGVSNLSEFSGNVVVVKYNSDGTPDTSFNGTGLVTTDVDGRADVPYAVAYQSDNKIVVGAAIADFTMAVLRYNPDGSLDSTFGNDGKAIVEAGKQVVFDLLVQPDGKIVGAGGCIWGYVCNFTVVRFNSDGTLDTSTPMRK